MVDTGASDCFLSRDTYDRIPEDAIWDVIRSTETRVRVGDSSHVGITEIVRIKFNIGGVNIFYEFLVMDQLAHAIIIGRDLLTDLQARIEPARREKICLFTGNPVSVIKGLMLKPGEEQIVQVTPWKAIKAGPGGTIRLEPSGISVAGVEHALNLVNKKWWVKVANFTDYPIYIGRHDVLAYVEEGWAPELSCTDLRIMFGWEDKGSRADGEKDGALPELNAIRVEEPEDDEVKRQKIMEMDLGETCMTWGNRECSEKCYVAI